ncbi:hypothetical protein HN415_00995 [Candidatus Woesearchaeota archaeon]|nr:hypothetical protein [Candidatus Woesearchaeota archaeon]
MEKEKAIVRQDVNFLEYPIWSVDRQSRQSVYKIKNDQGEYIFEALPNKIPNDTDMLILYYLLYTLQEKGQDSLNELIIYRVLKDLNISPSKRNYERFDQALKKWHKASVEFIGNFYFKRTEKDEDGQEHTIKGRTKKYFHFLKIKIDEEYKNNKLSKSKYTIKIDEDFLSAIEHSGFIKYVDLKRLVSLKTPVARRLDEWLPKQFIKQDRRVYKINHVNLFLKLRITIPKYISDVKRKLKTIQTGLDKINEFDEQYNYSIESVEKKENTKKISYIKIDKNGKEITVIPNYLLLITFKKEKKVINKDNKEETPKKSLIKKLKEYFIQSDEQANWILDNVNDSDLMFALDVLEKRYKKNEIKNIGAYTWGYFKKGQYKADVEQSRFDIEKKEKAEQQQKEQRRKELEEKLEQEYSKYINDCVKKYKVELSETEQQELKKQAEQNIKEKYPNYGIQLRKSVAKTEYRLLLNEEAEKQGLIIPFEEWKDKEIERMKKTKK